MRYSLHRSYTMYFLTQTEAQTLVIAALHFPAMHPTGHRSQLQPTQLTTEWVLAPTQFRTAWELDGSVQCTGAPQNMHQFRSGRLVGSGSKRVKFHRYVHLTDRIRRISVIQNIVSIKFHFIKCHFILTTIHIW